MNLKKSVSIATCVLLAAGLAACSETESVPTFEEKCVDRGGEVLTDSTSKLMTGTIVGTVIGSNGATGVGTGIVTSPVTFQVSLCLVSGLTVDMEVK